MANLVRAVCARSETLFTCLLIVGMTGCESQEITDHSRELCMVREIFYDHGPQMNGSIRVHSDGSYIWQEYEASHNIFSHQSSPGVEHLDILSTELLSSLKESISSNPQWTNIDGVPTCYFEVDDTVTKYPDAVIALRNFVRSPRLAQHLSADEIRKKIVGTWFVESEADWPPKIITVRFDTDGSFHSSAKGIDMVEMPQTNSADKLIYEATWEAKEGYFTVTRNHASPSNSDQIFGIERLTDREMICGHMSVAGRTVFRR